MTARLGTQSPVCLRNVMRFVALAIGAAHTTVAVLQQSMNEDGIDYLDMGDAYLRGDWDMAINGIWSPLYSWILGLVLKVVQPSIPWEFPVVQITNFVIYAVALLCFEYFWRELTRCRAAGSRITPETLSFHPALWLVLGYSLFIWSSLNMIEIWAVNPDMSVAALVYLAAGLFLALSRSPESVTTGVKLGLVLGLGYLAKAALLPLAIVLILLTAMIPAAGPGRFKRVVVSGIAFLIVAAPLLLALSFQYGQPIFSDVGRFTYLKHVNEMPYPNFHVALGRLEGEPEHPPRKIFNNPPIYEFAEPIGGTYPMSYNPSYWTRGLEPSIEVPQQARAIITQAMIYFELFFRVQGGFTAVVLLLILASLGTIESRKHVVAGLLVSLWALSCFGLYSLVHVAYRYIAPFVVLLWSGLLSLVHLPKTQPGRRIVNSGGALLVLFVWTNIAALNLEGLGAIVGFSPLSESGSYQSQFSDGHSADHPAIAEALLEEGLERGDQVGFIGYSYSAYWARLARLKIIAEIHPEDIRVFWMADAEHRERALKAFAEAGADAVVAEPTGGESPPPGWEYIGDSNYLLYSIR